MSKLTQTIDSLYKANCNEPSDINEHLPTLKKYASECSHVTEMGVRKGVSLTALLAARPEKTVGIDIILRDNVHKIKEIAESEQINFEYVLGDTRTMVIEPTDFLFIDTWHCYEQLKIELDRHHSKVNKYIGFHDTTSFAYKNEQDFPRWNPPLVKKVKEPKGLWPAIEEFLQEHPEWTIKERFTNNNGLTILEKIG